MHPGNRVQRLRERAGLSRVRLAEETGIDRNALGDLENGEMRGTSEEHLRILANYFNVPIERLMENPVEDLVYGLGMTHPMARFQLATVSTKQRCQMAIDFFAKECTWFSFDKAAADLGVERVTLAKAFQDYSTGISPLQAQVLNWLSSRTGVSVSWFTSGSWGFGEQENTLLSVSLRKPNSSGDKESGCPASD